MEQKRKKGIREAITLFLRDLKDEMEKIPLPMMSTRTIRAAI